MKHQTIESFLDAAHSDQLLMRSGGEVWLAWETEEGEWFAARPRNEDDPVIVTGDRWRPCGPTLVEDLKFPIEVVEATAAFNAQRAINDLNRRTKEAEKAYSDAGWARHMDRQGGA
ncbi:hypothetical protein NQ036_03770 [Brevibacterium sp. 91QC2O2]|uniref:hypothetical protein n=1 Tax=Brevibacterium TaxID=1696 RepID=UPI00211C4C73|nr:MULTISPECIES: hypothetical protein [unclassified Brevibacterium]MCQ9367365.1 hypothetical protein [Brevibacterium sp. 91QC2O2]MCQ9384622.1 hypothetical protein [Brevibacterium sp. 68QC2CO]